MLPDQPRSGTAWSWLGACSTRATSDSSTGAPPIDRRVSADSSCTSRNVCPATTSAACPLSRTVPTGKARLAWLTASIRLPSGTRYSESFAGSGTTRSAMCRPPDRKVSPTSSTLTISLRSLPASSASACSFQLPAAPGLAVSVKTTIGTSLIPRTVTCGGGMPTGMRFRLASILSLIRIAASSGFEPTTNRAVTIAPLSCAWV